MILPRGQRASLKRCELQTFLHVAGEDELEKYNAFDWELPQDKLVMAKVLSKFDDDCNMKTNVISERYKFLTRRQLPGESCDNFVTQLRSLCASCEYANPEEALRDQFVLQLRNERHREKLLHQAQIDSNTLTFAKSISMVKKIEVTVEHSKKRKNNDEQPDVFQLRMERTVKGKCSKCGRNHKFKECPAFGKI